MKEEGNKKKILALVYSGFYHLATAYQPLYVKIPFDPHIII